MWLKFKFYSHEILNTFRSYLKNKFQCMYEGTAKQGNPTPLNEIYTDSTSQRVRVERSVMSMRWDGLRHNPGEQQQRTHRSNAVTSLELYLDKTNPSELCWQRESLALEKQSLCRSSSWTGLKGKRIRTSSSYFHFLSERSIWWRTKHTVFQTCFISFSLKQKK